MKLLLALALVCAASAGKKGGAVVSKAVVSKAGVSEAGRNDV